MNHDHKNRLGANFQLTDRLIELAGSPELNRMLRYRTRPIDQEVIRRLKDEVARLIRADIHRATELAEATCAAAELTDDPVSEALAHHATALARHFSGGHVDALEHYQNAESIYRLLGRDVESARVTRAKISVLMILGRYEEAIREADEARQIFQKHGQDLLTAQLDSNIGCLYHRLDRYQEALTYFQRAERVFAAHEDELGLAHVRHNAADQYTQLNEFELALELYQGAKKSYEILNMPLAVNHTEYSIAWCYYLRGRIYDSLKRFSAVRETASLLGDIPLVALCDLDLADVYLQLNCFQDAQESAMAAREKFHSLQMNYEAAKAQMYMGIASTHLGDLRAAHGDLEEARRLFQNETNQVYAALVDVYLSDVLTREHNPDRAWQLCVEARKLFRDLTLPAKQAYAECQMARLKLSAGEAEEAESIIRSAMERLAGAEAPWLTYQCWHLLGRVMQHRNRRQEAYQYYNRAIRHLEGLRSGIRLDEFKCAFLKDKLRIYEDMVDLCLQAGPDAMVQEAFVFAEAAKSRALVDLLAPGDSIPSKAADHEQDRLHHEWQSLREELNWCYQRISQFERRSDHRPSWLGAQLQTEARNRESALAKLARQLRLQDAEYTSLQTVSRIEIEQLQSCLADDEVLLEYFTTQDKVHAFVVTRTGITAAPDLSQRDRIIRVLRRLRFYFEKFTLEQQYVRDHLDQFQVMTDQYLKQLYAELIEPVNTLIADRNLIIVPHEVLHYLPFHALFDGTDYLIDRHSISYCPSSSVFQLCCEKTRRSLTRGPALIMGIPDEAAPTIREEVEATRSHWPDAWVHVGKEATIGRFQELAPYCRFLHLASHGTFRRDNPMFSALKLSDGWLTLYDLFNLNLQAELVTLSACETGINEVFPGDELFGLMRGFLYAGAPSLVLSLWMVHDRSTTQLMKGFYGRLKQGVSKRDALRQAQLEVKHDWRHPYYWAPFILMGTP